HLVHLVARVAQRVLDDVQGDDVHVYGGHVAGSRLNYLRHGSALRGTDEEAAAGMHGGGVAGQDEGGGVHLGDDGRAGDHVPGPQGGPVVDGRVGVVAVDPDPGRPGQRGGGVGTPV